MCGCSVKNNACEGVHLKGEIDIHLGNTKYSVDLQLSFAAANVLHDLINFPSRVYYSV